MPSARTTRCYIKRLVNRRLLCTILDTAIDAALITAEQPADNAALDTGTTYLN